MNKIGWLIVILATILVSCNQNQEINGLHVRSQDYLGQVLPNERPKVFAGGIISTGMSERDISISHDGNEIYYSLSSGDWSTIMVARRINGSWFDPVVAEFARDTTRFFSAPSISHDGLRILFSSSERGMRNQQIWKAEREPGGTWGKPCLLPPSINTAQEEFYPSLAKNGNLYFSRRDTLTKKTSIYFSKWENGEFSLPLPLPAPVNGPGFIYNASIAPDESFLVACAVGRDSLSASKAATYMLFFHNPDGTWSKGIDLVKTLRLPCREAISMSVSPNGTYLFYAAANRTQSYKDFAPGWELSNFHRIRNLQGNGSSDIFWFNFKKVMFRL